MIRHLVCAQPSVEEKSRAIIYLSPINLTLSTALTKQTIFMVEGPHHACISGSGPLHLNIHGGRHGTKTHTTAGSTVDNTTAPVLRWAAQSAALFINKDVTMGARHNAPFSGRPTA